MNDKLNNKSATFESFLKFVGDTPFERNERFDSLMEELERLDAVWTTRLEDKAGDKLLALTDQIRGSSILATGPLEATLEWHLAKAGASRVLGVEGYYPNYLKCQALSASFPDLPLEFMQGDVTELDLEEEFDIIISFGVLYHLHKPQVLMEKIKSMAPRLFFLGTQLAVDPPHPAFEYRGLGDTAEIEFEGKTYPGRWYPDRRVTPRNYKSGLEDDRYSFWFYPDSLKQMLSDMGFEIQMWVVTDLGGPGSVVFTALSTPGRFP